MIHVCPTESSGLLAHGCCQHRCLPARARHYRASQQSAYVALTECALTHARQRLSSEPAQVVD